MADVGEPTGTVETDLTALPLYELTEEIASAAPTTIIMCSAEHLPGLVTAARMEPVDLHARLIARVDHFVARERRRQESAGEESGGEA